MSKTFQSPLFKEPELVQLGSVWRHWGLQVTRPPQSHRDRPSLSLKLSLLVSGKEGAEVLVRESPAHMEVLPGLEVLPRPVQPFRSPGQKGHPHTLASKVKAPA